MTTPDGEDRNTQQERDDEKIAEMKIALEWYAERAQSLAEKDWKNKPDYAIAILTELALDGGARARKALSQ